MLRTDFFRGIQATNGPGIVEQVNASTSNFERLAMVQAESNDPELADGEDFVEAEEDVAIDEEEDIPDDTIVFSTAKGSDNVGDVSVEINVEELIKEFEASQNDEAARKKEIRRRLEEIREQREAMKELEDTFAGDLDDD
jgi:predicted FMN-binding regulatory protein PaiB